MTMRTTWQNLGDWIYGATNVTAVASSNGNIYLATGWTGNGDRGIKILTATNGWTELDNVFSIARYDAAICLTVENGKEYIYVIGGQDDDYGVDAVLTKTVEKYDIALGTVAFVADMPTLREDAYAVNIGDKIYVHGGANGTPMNKVEIYDIPTNTWTTGVPSKYTYSSHGAVAYNGKLYVFGGRGTGRGKVEVFDPATQLWTDKTDMLVGCHHYALDIYNDKVFVVGGDDDEVTSNDSLKTLQIYDIATDSWTKGTDLPIGNDRHAFAFTKDPARKGVAYSMMGWKELTGNRDVYKLTVTDEVDLDLNKGTIVDIAKATFEGNANVQRFNFDTHTFMDWYKAGIRYGWFGYGTSGTTSLQLKCESGDIAINPKSSFDYVVMGGKMRAANLAAGEVSITPVANAITTKAITFGKTFEVPPVMSVSVNTSGPYTVLKMVSFSSVTTTGCNINIYRTDTTVTEVHWMAFDPT